MIEDVKHTDLRTLLTFDNVDLKAFALGISLIVSLNLYYVITTPGTTLSTFLVDTSLSYVVMCIVASFYRYQRTKTKETLREKEKRFRTLLENSMDSITVNIGTELVYGNKYFADLLGYSDPSELIGKNITEFYSPEQREIIKTRTLRRQKGEEELKRYESKLLRRDGTQIDIETRATVVEYKGKVATLAFTRDITERKKYEEKLEALHRHSDELTKAETVADVAESTLRAIEQTLGFSYLAFGVVEGNLLHFTPFSGVPMIRELPLDGPGITVRAVRSGETQLISDTRTDDDYISGHIDGEPDSLSELDVPVKIDDEVAAIINIESTKPSAFTKQDQRLLEIFAEHIASTLKRIQLLESQRNYEAKLSALHSSAVKLATTVIPDEVYVIALETIKEILGFQWAGVGFVDEGGIHYVEYEGFELPKGWTLPLNGPGITVRAAKTGRSQLVPDVRADPDYIKTQYDDSAPLLSELAVPVIVNGRVEAMINVESTEVNAFTENDQKLLETLAQHIASAIVIIRQKELLQKSLQELERSNRELDNYTYVVSHDLKAPLRSIMAFSSFLLDDYREKIDETGQEYLKRISDATKRMNQLIQDLLVLSRVNRKYTDEELVGLNKLVEEIKLDFNAQLEESGGEIIVGELPKIRTQKVWMRQLFANLISNGLKFNESPTPIVEVGCKEHQKDYIFSVKDNGIGIREEDQKRLFKLFQRLHTQDEYEGTGAGLAICKKIVESFGGEIWVESQHGSGSTFYFKCPNKRKDDTEMTVSQPQMDHSVKIQEGPLPH